MYDVAEWSTSEPHFCGKQTEVFHVSKQMRFKSLEVEGERSEVWGVGNLPTGVGSGEGLCSAPRQKIFVFFCIGIASFGRIL